MIYKFFFTEQIHCLECIGCVKLFLIPQASYIICLYGNHRLPSAIQSTSLCSLSSSCCSRPAAPSSSFQQKTGDWEHWSGSHVQTSSCRLLVLLQAAVVAWKVSCTWGKDRIPIQSSPQPTLHVKSMGVEILYCGSPDFQEEETFFKSQQNIIHNNTYVYI